MEGNFDKNFLEIVNNIFSNRYISYDLLLNKIMRSVSQKFANEEFFDSLLLEGFMNIRFIDSLKLFNNKRKGENHIMIEKNEKNKKFLDYLELHQETLDSDIKKAVFLTGVLVGKLLNIQYSERKSTPFYTRLNGLKLNDKLIKRIYTEAINKLNEYNKNYYTELESVIAEYMLSKDTLSDDETSFFFALGMTLSKKIQNEDEKQKNQEEEQRDD
jgi:CRISPR-associated protein Csh1